MLAVTWEQALLALVESVVGLRLAEKDCVRPTWQSSLPCQAFVSCYSFVSAAICSVVACMCFHDTTDNCDLTATLPRFCDAPQTSHCHCHFTRPCSPSACGTSPACPACGCARLNCQHPTCPHQLLGYTALPKLPRSPMVTSRCQDSGSYGMST